MNAARIAGLAIALMVLSGSSAEAAGFQCSASAGRIVVLDQTVEPLTANASGAACAGDKGTLTGSAAGFDGPLTIGALLASTEVFPAQKIVVSTGGVADLTVSAAPDLPITLPRVAVPDAAKVLLANALKTTVDLSTVTGAIPLLPTNLVTGLPTNLVTNLVTDLPTNLVTSLPTNLVTNLPTNLVTNLVTNLPTNLRTDYGPLDVNLLDPLMDTLAEVLALNDTNAALNTANAATNAANLATNAANAALNAANLATNAANLALNTANAATNAANLATNTANAAANAANAALNTANAALNAVRAAIPGSVAIDGAGGLDSALATLLPDGRLPNVDLLRVQGAIARAAGACRNGAAVVSGSSTVSGITVFGQSIPVGTVVDQVLTLINAASIDPSSLGLPAIELGLTPAQRELINGVPAAKDALDAAIAAARAALRNALDSLAPISVLDPTVARVRVTPGARTQDATSVTQRALNIAVTIAGQSVVDAVIGEARASSAGVDCDDPVIDPNAITQDKAGSGTGGGLITVPGIKAPIDPDTPAGATLQCSTRRLVLVDVLERDHRVRLNGVADPALAGKRVAIVFEGTGRVVAHAKVARNGWFDTTAPLPPVNLRDTNDARYRAKLGEDESINLKLRRRMVLKSIDSEDGSVTISGRVLPPLGVPLEAITLSRRVSCEKEQVVARFKPRPDGFFRVTVKAPKGVGAAVYRMTTQVRFSAAGSALFETYTLPRAVELNR
ncbi:MAG TPA: hypothetical protein VMZ66_10580 [Aeromicrobium sp.]|nr:hypothetical protein [Aeromicrobium sp.]